MLRISRMLNAGKLIVLLAILPFKAAAVTLIECKGGNYFSPRSISILKLEADENLDSLDTILFTESSEKSDDLPLYNTDPIFRELQNTQSMTYSELASCRITKSEDANKKTLSHLKNISSMQKIRKNSYPICYRDDDRCIEKFTFAEGNPITEVSGEVDTTYYKITTGNYPNSALDDEKSEAYDFLNTVHRAQCFFLVPINIGVTCCGSLESVVKTISITGMFTLGYLLVSEYIKFRHWYKSKWYDEILSKES